MKDSLSLQMVDLILALMHEPRVRERLAGITLEHYSVLLLCMPKELAEGYFRLFVQLFSTADRAMVAVQEQHALSTMLFTLKTIFQLATMKGESNTLLINFGNPLMLGGKHHEPEIMSCLCATRQLPPLLPGGPCLRMFLIIKAKQLTHKLKMICICAVTGRSLESHPRLCLDYLAIHTMHCQEFQQSWHYTDVCSAVFQSLLLRLGKW